MNNVTIEDGYVIGFFKTSKCDIKTTYKICKVALWESLEEEDQIELAKDALYQSGLFYWWY